MEGARDAGEHDAQAGAIGDHGGQWPELNGGIVERPPDTRSRRPAKRCAALTPVEIVQQVISLTEPALRLDLGAKPRCAGPGIAFERGDRGVLVLDHAGDGAERRSEEHTSELQSLMRISYAVFCLKKKTKTNKHNTKTIRPY